MDEIRLAGAIIKVMELWDRGEIQKLPEKLVFNCTGLGAKALFNDEELVPLKGQLTILLPQPEVQYATVALPPEVYMFPRTDGILWGAPTKWVYGRSIPIWRVDSIGRRNTESKPKRSNFKV
jgi:D-amino-acid oxidase